MFTWVGFSSLILMDIKEKFQNVYRSDRGKASASQRQQLPLQQDSAKGALSLATTATSASRESSPNTAGKAPSHCVPVTGSIWTHIHLQPQSKSSCCPWALLQLQVSPWPPWGEHEQLKLTQLLSREADQSPKGLPKGHVPDLCAGPGRETRKEAEEERFCLWPGTRVQPHGCGEKHSWNRPWSDNNLQRCFNRRDHRFGLEETFKDHLVLFPSHGQEHLSLDLVAPSPLHPDFEHLWSNTACFSRDRHTNPWQGSGQVKGWWFVSNGRSEQTRGELGQDEPLWLSQALTQQECGNLHIQERAHANAIFYNPTALLKCSKCFIIVN